MYSNISIFEEYEYSVINTTEKAGTLAEVWHWLTGLGRGVAEAKL